MRDWTHDLDAMGRAVDESTRLIFVANPNNPTGTWNRRAEVEALTSSLPPGVLLVLDEAYFEYADDPDYPDGVELVRRGHPVVVTRTFSKAYGLAGLRVGYGLSHPDLAELLNRVRQPFNVNSLALVAAEAALDDREHIETSVELNRQGMARLTAGFESLGLSYIPSVGNFVTLDLGRPAADPNQALLRAGCIARPVGNYGLPRHLRVTVGMPEENERFLAALAQVLGQ
jgi:histidinol-phosphate aminotransferase